MSDLGFNFDAEALEQAIKDRWKNNESTPTIPTDDGSGDVTPPVDDETPDLDSEDTEDTEDTDTEDDDTDTEDDDEGGEGDNPPPTSGPQAIDYIDLPNGVRITREQAEAYYAFDQRLRYDEQLREYLSRYGQQAPTPASPSGQGGDPSSPAGELPPDLDLDDPTIKFLVDRQAALEAQLKQVAQVTTATQSQIAERQEAEMRSFTNRAVASFQKEHNLNDEEMLQVREVAARINAVNTYLGGTHPITGEPVAPDPLAAIDTALSIAYNNLPDVVEKANNRVVKRQLDDRNRKKKLGKISGSSGSAPRTAPAPANRSELRAAFINEVRGLMSDGE